MTATPYLIFNGNCREALEFYAEVLGGKIQQMQLHSEAPIADELPAEHHNLIMHARLEAGSMVLMASDSPPEHYSKPQGLYVSLHLESADEAERIYGALSKDGEIHMKLEETFWAERFAMFIDRFGTPWMINSGDKM